MIAYVDASVVLRLALGQQPALAEWRQVDTAVASALMEVECLRTLDRLRNERRLGADDVTRRYEAVYALIESFEVVGVTPAILRRAAHPLPLPLGTLDAIHLATAAAWRDAREEPVVMATHDRALAAAARASGFQTIG